MNKLKILISILKRYRIRPALFKSYYNGTTTILNCYYKDNYEFCKKYQLPNIYFILLIIDKERKEEWVLYFDWGRRFGDIIGLKMEKFASQ